VPDAKAITDFYEEKFRLPGAAWMENFFSFLRCGPDRPQRPKVWKREDGAMVWGYRRRPTICAAGRPRRTIEHYSGGCE
jgi:hypothetical protein